MERNFYTEGFESFLKDKSDQYKLYPSDKVWKNINRKLHPKRRWPYLAAALLLVGIGVGGKFYLDEQGQKPGVSLQDENSQSQQTAIASAKEEKNNSEVIVSSSSKSAPALSSPLKLAYINPALSKSADAIQDGKENSNSLNQGEEQEGDELKTFRNPLISYPGINDISEADEEVTNSPELLLARPIEGLGTAGRSSLLKKSVTVQSKQENEEQLSLTQKLIHKLSKVHKKTGWEFHVAPSVSYRRLIGSSSDIPFNYTAGTMYSTNATPGTDVSFAVNQRPSVGMEVGGSLVYPLTKNLRVRAGLQFNYNRYQIRAYNYKPELANFGVDYSGANARSINTISYYRNYSGNSLTRLHNERFMVSVPLGIELTLFGNDRVKFNVASTIQPTYIFDNNSYLISTNMKNYAQEPSLYRNWNVNAGLEGFLSIKTGSYNWVVGPQFRYQVLSSYKDNYPISEHLVDYGFKIGIMKPIR